MFKHCLYSVGRYTAIISNCSCRFGLNGQPLQPVRRKLKGGLYNLHKSKLYVLMYAFIKLLSHINKG